MQVAPVNATVRAAGVRPAHGGPVPSVPTAPTHHSQSTPAGQGQGRAAKRRNAASLDEIAVGLGRFFSAPAGKGPIAARVAAIMRSIDWSKNVIVLWVPGTSEWTVNDAFAAALAKELPGHKPVAVPYEASWRFSTSVADGNAVLTELLRQIAKKNKGKRRIVLAGESQGAWVISNVLADPRLRGVVSAAGLWGHPGAASNHFHAGHPRVMEINDPMDWVALPLGPGGTQAMEGIEMLARRNFLGGITKLAAYSVRNPNVLVTLLGANLWRIPLLGKAFHDPHEYDDDITATVPQLVRTALATPLPAAQTQRQRAAH